MIPSLHQSLGGGEKELAKPSKRKLIRCLINIGDSIQGIVLLASHSPYSTNRQTYIFVAEWLRAWDTLIVFEATVCGRL